MSKEDIKKSANYEDFVICIASNNSVTVTKNNVSATNTKAALREVASQVGFEVEDKWTTQQLGSKLVDYLNANGAKAEEPKEEHKVDEGLKIASDVYAILAYLVADMDDEITKKEVEMILAFGKEYNLDMPTIRQRLMLEKMGIREFTSHTEMALKVPEEWRKKLYGALCFVALADNKVKDSELQVLTGIGKTWGISFELCQEYFNDAVRIYTEESGKDLEVDE